MLAHDRWNSSTSDRKVRVVEIRVDSAELLGEPVGPTAVAAVGSGILEAFGEGITYRYKAAPRVWRLVRRPVGG